MEARRRARRETCRVSARRRKILESGRSGNSVLRGSALRVALGVSCASVLCLGAYRACC